MAIFLDARSAVRICSRREKLRSIFKSHGVSLSVSEHGEGKPFVFQHGLCGDADQLIQVFPEDTGYRCLMVECRGHGQSEADPLHDLSIPMFADDVAGYIQHLSRPVIGGISMGAAISLQMAIRWPHIIRALIVARPAWLTNEAPKSAYPNLFVGQLLSQSDPQDALSRFEASAVARGLAEQSPDNLSAARGFFTRLPIPVTSVLLTAITMSGPGVTEDEIRTISVPTRSKLSATGARSELWHSFCVINASGQPCPPKQACEEPKWFVETRAGQQ
ncbi:alpha/beta fold hydrolase [Rhizobium nepotum]|uniref:alpha/beta fold hydrolase n=1 Tax=Rhizobium nepotum TaxID=1035271 RepID=UPI000A001C16